MRAAYLDSSWLLAMAFDEPGAEDRARRLDDFDVLLATGLTEAELASACAREGQILSDRFVRSLDWIEPDRRLTPEIEKVLAAGHLRGAELWHVAVALYAAEAPRDLAFLTLDERQREVAATLGFQTPI